MRKTLATAVAVLALTAGFSVASVHANASPTIDTTAPCDQQYAGGGECHPDAGNCASYHEADRLRLGMRRAKVRHILGTSGRIVGKRAMQNATGGMLQMLNLGPGEVDSPRPKYRQVRRYVTCAEDGVPADLLVEYRVRGGRGRATQILWS